MEKAINEDTAAKKLPGLDMYLNFPGCCEKAFLFYEKHLGGLIEVMMAHEHPPPHFPADWTKPILHAVMQIAGTVVRGADIPGARPMRSAYLTLRCGTAEEAEQIYQVLSTGGDVFMKMEKTFFANRFAMLRDQFGISWMLLHENPE